MGIKNEPRDAISARANPTIEPMNKQVPIVTRAKAPLT